MLDRSIILMLTVLSITKGGYGSLDSEWTLGQAMLLRLNKFNGNWFTGDEFQYQEVDGQLYKYNAATDKSSVFLEEVLDVYRARFTGVQFFKDPNVVLVGYDSQMRGNDLYSKLDIYELTSGNSTTICGGERITNFFLSPGNNRLAYIFENDIFIFFEDGSEVKLTNDGVEDNVFNGDRGRWLSPIVAGAFWWAPDGLKIACTKHNASEVEIYSYPFYGNGEQYYETIGKKYPKPGAPIGETTLLVFDLSDSTKTSFSPLTLKGPVEIVTEEHVLQNLVWIDNENFLVFWINRRQDVLTIQRCTLEGQCDELTRLEEEAGWIKIGQDLYVSSEACFFQYWIGDWYQVWKLDLKTGRNLWKSRGDFTVTELYGYDEKEDKLYYQATLPGEPYVGHIFVNDECLSCSLRDVDNKYCRMASASFSKNYKYCAVICKGPGPAYVSIIETQTKRLIREWESNSKVREKIASKSYPTKRFMNVTLGDGFTRTVALLLPPNFDASKKYPMIVHNYAEPDHVMVRAEFDYHYNIFVTTTLGCIYAKIDGRGSGNKGKKMLFSIKNNLGTPEVEDQISVTKYLQDNFPFIDRDRTGIWGWSYGGYTTAMVLGKDSENIFKCGVSVAAVTSWLYYYTGYTERLMGFPTKDNMRNYTRSELMNNLDYLSNHRFLVMHGTADENVHYQHFLQLVKILYRRGILFDQMSYIDQDHSLRGTESHLYFTMTKFWSECFDLGVSYA